MIKIAILLVLIAIISASKTAYLTGTDATIRYAGGHVLQDRNNVPRSVDVTIKFKNAFEEVPKVAVSAYLLDWQVGVPQGFHYNVHQVTTEQFVLRVTAVSAKQYYSLFVNWIAIVDPRVHVQFFETTALPNLISGENKVREDLFNIEITENTMSSTPVAIPFIAGVNFVQRNYLAFLSIVETSPKHVTLKAKTWYITKVQMIRACILFGEPSALWVSDIGTFRVPDGNHPFLKRANSGTQVSSTVSLPLEVQKTTNPYIYGLTGFDGEEARNQRVASTDGKFAGDKFEVQLKTWWDSQVYQIDWQVAIYKYDPDYQVFNPECAVLYSAYDYKGDSIHFCDRINSLPKEGWNKDIKSVYVPKNKIMTLFSQEFLKGKKITYHESQTKLEDIVLSLGQLTKITLESI